MTHMIDHPQPSGMQYPFDEALYSQLKGYAVEGRCHFWLYSRGEDYCHFQDHDSLSLSDIVSDAFRLLLRPG
jgi:hypothetical protein